MVVERTIHRQRHYERLPFYCRLQLTILPNGPVIAARSFDISAGGVGITSNVLLDPGQSVRVRFHLPNGSYKWIREDVVGNVAYSRADEDGNRIGIEFLETIQESRQPVLAQKLSAL